MSDAREKEYREAEDLARRRRQQRNDDDEYLDELPPAEFHRRIRKMIAESENTNALKPVS